MEPSGTGTPEGASSGLEYITPVGYQKSGRCGYCGTTDQSQSKRFSYFATAVSLSPQFYQTLLDRYWRRSGTLLYRPNQRASCCPHYTIRLDSDEFKPSRDQRQTINRFNKYVTGEEYANQASRLYPRSRKEAKQRNNEFHLVERVHEAEYAQIKTPPEPAHKFVVTLEENTFTQEKWRVYDNYQKVVHKDPPDQRRPGSFKRFLCDSPLRRETMVVDGRERQLGSFHQCYRLDGKLVAVGVLDLLPQCVSSVYFFYDESLHKFAPGKLGALHEIALTAEKGYRWWYPGFYIHTCPKMRYKIDYAPQYILDPENLSWDPLDREVLNLLDKKKYVSLSAERQSAANGDVTIQTDVSADDEDAEDEICASLFRVNMPGIPSISQMEDVDLDHIAFKIFPKAPLVVTAALRDWGNMSIHTWPGLKSAIAEMVAALGTDCVESICIDFANRG